MLGAFMGMSGVCSVSPSLSKMSPTTHKPMKVQPRKSGARRGSSPRPATVPARGLQHVTMQLQREQIRALQDRIAILQAELRAQTDRDSERVDAHPLPYIELLANGIIRYASHGAVALLDAGQQVVFQPLRACISADDVERLFRHIHQCLTAEPERLHIETDISLNSAAGSKSVR